MQLLLMIFMAGLVTTLAVLRTCLLIVEVHGESMSPALSHGDRVVVLRRFPAARLRRGHVVVVVPWTAAEVGEKRFIKRIVGLPGDRVETHVAALHEAVRASQASLYDADGRRFWDVPAGHVFVQGDAKGSDSRTWGPIAFSTLRGLVVGRLPSRPGRLPAAAEGAKECV